VTSIGAPGSYYGKQNFDKAGKSTIHGVRGLERHHGTDTFLTEALTLEAKHHVGEAVASGKPFYLNFAHYAVHAPFDSDPRFAANYRASGKSAEAQAFATLVEGMDKSLGDLLDHLETLGVADNTLIFFLGDNGSDAPLGHQHEVACAAPLRGKKGSHYEGGTRVPLIVSWAKTDATRAVQQHIVIAAGAIQPQQAAVYDLFPTILDAVEIGVSGNHIVDGLSLVPLLTGKRDAARPTRFLMHYPHAPHRSDYFTVFRDGPWKVIYHYFPTKVSGGSHYQLFRLDRDPFEQHDLAATEPKELRRIMEGLIAALEEQDALYHIGRDDGKPVRPTLP
jgi:arylsulfatase A-like enzyme